MCIYIYIHMFIHIHIQRLPSSSQFATNAQAVLVIGAWNYPFNAPRPQWEEESNGRGPTYTAPPTR